MITLLSLLPLAWAGSVGGSTAPLNQVYAPRRVAVLVGVDSYQDPALDPLRFAAKDARDLARILQADSGGSFDRVLVVTGPEATTAAGIQRAIDVATADLQRDDTFLLYMSGHGTLTIDPSVGTRLWFLPSDGRLSEAPRTGLAVDWLEERVADVDARRRVLILDTCHNGRDKSSLDPATARLLEGMRGEPPAPRSFREVSESEARLYAAQYYQPAMEDGQLRNGVYTHFLVEALSTGAAQADLDGDGLVDVTEAHAWARDRTIQWTGGMQVPRAEFRIVGREEIYLAGSEATRSAAERALLAATDSILSSARVLVDGQPRGVLPELVALEPGRRRIEVQSAEGELLLHRTVRVQPGQTVMIEDLLPSSAPSWDLVGGVWARQQPALLVLPPVGLALELSRVHPGLGPRWLAPDLHLRGGWGLASMPVENLPVDVAVQGLDLGLGVGLGVQARRLPLTLGPTLDAGVLGRRYEGYYGPELQAIPTLSAGLRASWRAPLPGGRTLVLRAESRALPLQYEDAWSLGWQHGVAAGLVLP